MSQEETVLEVLQDIRALLMYQVALLAKDQRVKMEACKAEIAPMYIERNLVKEVDE